MKTKSGTALDKAINDLRDALIADDAIDHWHYLISKEIQRGVDCDINAASRTATKIMNDIFEMEI